MMYIGGSTDITGRYTHHRFFLRRGAHKTKALQALWNEHGETAFEFVTLERCEPIELRNREDAWIKSYASCINTFRSATHEGPHGPSAAKKVAARKRWSNSSYRAKRQPWLDRRDQGRFTPEDGTFIEAGVYPGT